MGKIVFDLSESQYEILKNAVAWYSGYMHEEKATQKECLEILRSINEGVNHKYSLTEWHNLQDELPPKFGWYLVKADGVFQQSRISSSIVEAPVTYACYWDGEQFEYRISQLRPVAWAYLPPKTLLCGSSY